MGRHQASSIKHLNILIVGLSIQPSPEFNPRAAFFGAIPGPGTPTLGIPPAEGKPQVQFSGADMLQDLAEGAGEVLEVVGLELGVARVGSEVEARENVGLR